MTARGWWLILFSAGLMVGANLLFRAGVSRAGGFGASFSEIPSGLLHLAAQPLFDIGFMLYAFAALAWFRVIATEALSIAYPLLISLAFILITLSAVILFEESFTLRKLVGMAVILLGVFLVQGRYEAQK